jgi:predicted ester cyclase
MRARPAPAKLGAMDNKAVVRTFVEQFQTGHDWTVFDRLIDPDVVDHAALPGTPPGRDGVRALFEGFLAAFPDFRARIRDQIVEADKVVTRKTFSGTHAGEFMGIPPTGSEVEFDVIDIVRVRGGRIVEHWNVVDQLSLLRQLRVVPVPAQA